MAEKNQKLKVIKTVTTVNGTLYGSAVAALTSTMSYKYSLYSLNGIDDFASAGSELSTSTTTLAQGITKTFSSLGWGYYGIKVEIEDSSTGSDAGLEKCYQWVGAEVMSPVCNDPAATNINTTVPANL